MSEPSAPGGAPCVVASKDHPFGTRSVGSCSRRRATGSSVRRLLVLSALVLPMLACTAPLPYNEAADARAEVQQALATARAAGRSVLLIFGANWCKDCRALDAAIRTPKNAELIGAEFVVVKIDVGNFDRNTALTEQYGNPTKRGIPAAVVVSASNQVLYTTRLGELSSARRMSDSGVYDFFSTVAASTRAAK
ncbi:MAG: hypothetical protein RL375_4477 [Pseudomonadota bacterium]